MPRPIALEPFDVHNQTLQANVHPPDWVNPTPTGRYHLVVIGAGTAGLVAAAGAAGLGAKVAIIERGLMGGDCLNAGCVPSKALIAAARVAASLRGAAAFGVERLGDSWINFETVMDRMRRLRAGISPNDSAARFRDLGVDVYFGEGRFVARDAIDVHGTRLTFKKALIATGTRPALPRLPGIDDVGVLTNESLFSLTTRPRRLTVIGGGPIGVELSQAFARLGSDVTLIQRSSRILPRDDPEAAMTVQKALEKDGARIILDADVQRFERRGDETAVFYQRSGESHESAADAILVAAGRAPNIQNLGLAAAGIESDEKQGVYVNDFLQTSNRAVYAAGDVCSKFKFTHAADFMARAVLRNALFMGRSRMSSLVIPWCTYASPELAQVGLTPAMADQQNVKIDTYTQSFANNDRAVLEGGSAGFVRAHVKRGSDVIVGATIVGAEAGELISAFTFAMTHGLGLREIGTAIHPYPTRGEAIRKLGDHYQRARLTPLVKTVFRKWLAWTR